MSLWTLQQPPNWGNMGHPPAVATPAGWADPITGELLVAIVGLSTFKEPNGAPELTHVYFDKTAYGHGSVAHVIAQFNEPVVVTGTPQVTISVNGTNETCSYVKGASAAATATYAAGGEYQVITVVVGTPGTDYWYPPTVALSGGGGTYTSATATVAGGGVTGVIVTGATGYTGNPTVAFSDANSEFMYFAYTVQDTDVATAGELAISSPIALNGGTIKGTNNTVLTLTSITGTFPAQRTQATATAVESGGNTVTVTVTNPGAGYFSGAPTVTLAGGGGTYTSATATVVDGEVTAITVAGAAGYTSNPSVALTAPPQSASSVTSTVSGATSHATGVVKRYDQANSLLYLTQVTGTFQTSEVVSVVGSGATAGTPVLSPTGGLILSIPVSAGGSGYLIPPTVTITDGSGTLASAFAVLSGGVVTSIVVQAAGANYVSPSVSIAVQGSGTTSAVSAPPAPLAFADDASVALTVMNAVVPTISSITIPAGSYTTGEIVPITVTFSKPIAVIGNPTMTVNMSDSSTTGTAVSVVGASSFFAGANGFSTTLVYNYTVQAADVANQSDFTISSPLLVPNGSSIRDEAGNPATLTHSETFPLVGVNDKGGVLSITLANNANTTNGALNFITGDTMYFTVNFDQPVVITGSPELPINVDLTGDLAVYSSGSGSTAIVFAYTVLDTDVAAQSQLTTGTSITLNGGTVKDLVGTNSGITFTQASFSTATVNSAFAMRLSGQPAAGNHITGEVETLAVTFNEQVTVTGAPYLSVVIGSNTRHFAYSAGSGTTVLSFTYTLVSGDAATATNYTIGAISLNGGTIDNANANAATLTFTPPSTAGVVVNDPAPTMSTPTIAAGNYLTAATIPVVVAFNKTVNVTGTPTVAITTTGGAQVATYASGSGTSNLTFNYVVQSSDTIGAVSSSATSITLSGGTIKDLLGTVATNSFSAASTFANVATNDVLATLGTPVGTSTGSGTYPNLVHGDVFIATFTASKAVTVTGAPYVALTTVGGTRHVAYASGSGSTTLVFHYTTVAGDEGIAGTITLASAVTLNSGTMDDALGIPVTLTFSPLSTSLVAIS